RESRDGIRLHAEGLRRGGRGRHGEPGRLHPRLDLRELARVARDDLGEPRASGDRLVRRAHPHAAGAAHRPVRADSEMSAATPPTIAAERAPDTRARGATGPSVGYWTGFAIVVSLLILAPLVLPEFWRRFTTEILIWGLLAMSSDLLIGYTGIV